MLFFIALLNSWKYKNILEKKLISKMWDRMLKSRVSEVKEAKKLKIYFSNNIF